MLNKALLWESCEQLQANEVLQCLRADTFLTVCEQISAMTQLLGPALKFAGKYMDTLLVRTRELAPGGASLVALTEAAPVYTMHHPGSIRHCVSRLIWLLDFTEALVTNLVSDKFTDQSVQACAAAAYEDRLAVNHKWFVRKAVRLALYACPSRDRLYREMTVEELNRLRQLLNWPVAWCYAFLVNTGLTLAVTE